MSSLKTVISSIESHHSLKGLVEVYEEMAALIMRRIRQSILDTRDYYSGLSTLSSEVATDLSVLPRTNSHDTVLVFLSADDSLYGDIVDRVYSFFVPAIKQNPTADVVVVGKMGINLMKMLAPQISFTPATLSPDLVSSLCLYDHVELFFGQFKSIARQEPSSRTLSARTIADSKTAQQNLALQLKYIYEPTVSQVAEIFAQQIFSGLYEQTLKEHELAKNASRLMHLDQALTNIDRRLDIDTRRYRLLKKRISSKSQHNQLAGYKATKNLRHTYV